MNRRASDGVLPLSLRLVAVGVVGLASAGRAAETPVPKTLPLTLQTRDGEGRVVRQALTVTPPQTAVVGHVGPALVPDVHGAGRDRPRKSSTAATPKHRTRSGVGR